MNEGLGWSTPGGFGDFRPPEGPSENGNESGTPGQEGGYLSAEHERRSSPEYREAVESAEKLLDQYADFMRSVKGILEFIKAAEDEEDWKSSLDYLDQGADGYLIDLREGMEKLAARRPLPPRVGKIVRALEDCVLFLESAQLGELGKKKREEVVDILQEFVGSTAESLRALEKKGRTQ